MRVFLPVIGILFMINTVFAYTTGTLSETVKDWGFYFGPQYRVTTVSGQTGYMSGFNFAIMMDHWFSIGYSAYWLQDSIACPQSVSNQTPYLNFSYSGLYLAFHLLSQSAIHVNVDLLGGMGELYYDLPNLGLNRQLPTYLGYIEPGVNIEITLLPELRFVAGANYRYVFGITGYTGFTPTELSGFSATVKLDFGWF